MLNHKLGAVRERINSLARLEAELAGALRSCNCELRLKREIKHEDCCPLLMNLDRVNGSNGNKHVSNRRKDCGVKLLPALGAFSLRCWSSGQRMAEKSLKVDRKKFEGIVNNLLHSNPVKREEVKVDMKKPEKLIPPQE